MCFVQAAGAAGLLILNNDPTQARLCGAVIASETYYPLIPVATINTVSVRQPQPVDNQESVSAELYL